MTRGWVYTQLVLRMDTHHDGELISQVPQVEPPVMNGTCQHRIMKAAGLPGDVWQEAVLVGIAANMRGQCEALGRGARRAAVKQYVEIRARCVVMIHPKMPS